MVVRLVLDLACATLLVRWVYYRRNPRADLFLTFFAFNLSIFFLTFLLNRVEMTMGAAFGLFAVFSMLRYRTENLAARDMTFLFLLIALGLMSAVAQVSLAVLLLIGAALVVGPVVFESSLLAPRGEVQRVDYDKLSLIAPAQRGALIADLRERTGLDVYRVDVERIDLVRDSASLIVHYRDEG